MKKETIMLTLLFGLSNANNLCAAQVPNDAESLIKEYKKMFYRISQKRVGVDQKEIERLHPPFLSLKVLPKVKASEKKDGTKVAQEVVYTLQAIINNRAKIGGKWYKLHDKIDDYMLAKIVSDGVVLKNSENEKRLTLRKENAKISIK